MSYFWVFKHPATEKGIVIASERPDDLEVRELSLDFRGQNYKFIEMFRADASCDYTYNMCRIVKKHFPRERMLLTDIEEIERYGL